jgi:hypothetical protein
MRRTTPNSGVAATQLLDVTSRAATFAKMLRRV